MPQRLTIKRQTVVCRKTFRGKLDEEITELCAWLETWQDAEDLECARCGAHAGRAGVGGLLNATRAEGPPELLRRPLRNRAPGRAIPSNLVEFLRHLVGHDGVAVFGTAFAYGRMMTAPMAPEMEP